MRWWRRRRRERRKGRSREDLERLVRDSETAADRMAQEASETARRLGPTLEVLEARKRENRIYLNVLATLGGGGHS